MKNFEKLKLFSFVIGFYLIGMVALSWVFGGSVAGLFMAEPLAPFDTVLALPFLGGFHVFIITGLVVMISEILHRKKPSRALTIFLYGIFVPLAYLIPACLLFTSVKDKF